MFVFVYGTLKRGCPNHYVLNLEENGKAEYVADGETEDLFPLITATEYIVPLLLDKKGTGKKVKGELYEIDQKMLETLDRFERNPEIYTRSEEKINTDIGTFTAWVFVFHSFRPSLLELDLLDTYTCTNYDMLRAQSGKMSTEERRELLKIVRAI